MAVGPCFSIANGSVLRPRLPHGFDQNRGPMMVQRPASNVGAQTFDQASDRLAAEDGHLDGNVPSLFKGGYTLDQARDRFAGSLGYLNGHGAGRDGLNDVDTLHAQTATIGETLGDGRRFNCGGSLVSTGSFS